MHKLILFCAVVPCLGFAWGFFAHKKINRLAVFTLPPEMIGFYKRNINYLSDEAVAPDRRRYAVEDEAPRHYIDLDEFGDSASYKLPRTWKKAVEMYGEEVLMEKGIVPWHIIRMYDRLQEAFMLSDPQKILRISAELGHYVSDANVPLHTTSNYDGQLTGQIGLHAFWESRLPELFFNEYDFFVGKATYIEDVPSYAWQAVVGAHRALDSVLLLEKETAVRMGNQKYSFETRGKQTIKVVSPTYAKAYHQALNGMIERKMRTSVKMTGDLWYTAWVNSGQPDLKKLIDYTPSKQELEARKKELEEWKVHRYAARNHDSDND
ncbi:MAG TPA: S1/P1 Nuclease [Cytophagales bacterium]|nr:S1/P1 Nuclease [Cytophagales bacterium]HCR54269.1 S1/P1 Nuclease [Cytophagales bacterium]